MSPELSFVVAIAASYLFGAIPAGLLIARTWAGIDIREFGSGNTGATNVYRVVSKPAGVVVFLLDMLKGLLPPLAATMLGWPTSWQIVVGLASMLGHSVSPFLGFKGGKGISTALGILFGVSWKVGLAAWALWAVVLGVSGYVSLGSIVAALSLIPFTMVFYSGDTPRLAFAVAAGAIAIIKHKANIKRLLNGTESGFRNKKQAAQPSEEQDDSGDR